MTTPIAVDVYALDDCYWHADHVRDLYVSPDRETLVDLNVALDHTLIPDDAERADALDDLNARGVAYVGGGAAPLFKLVRHIQHGPHALAPRPALTTLSEY